MRLPRLPLAAALVLTAAAARADDTADFLKPDNWEGLPEYWKVDGTTVTGSADKDPGFNTFLCSKKKYGDFELSFKVQLKDGKGNSGVQVRSSVVDPQKFVVAGPQADIGAEYWGSLYGERVGGWLKKAPKNHAKAAEFNDYQVTVRGNHVTIKVNGETTIDEDFPDNKGKDPAPAEGVIAFQLHAGGPMTVTFKDIQFTDLGKK
ncbi:MAG: DUF1080 domain-containing protein [Gemmataceae bacterium]|nr:DUF1080 domain-containing protein [Gemmataceae bacterium]